MAMSRGTLIALNRSIKHWQENLAENDVRKIHINAERCALCKRFNLSQSFCYRESEGCPVMLLTGKAWCGNSPFTNAARALSNWKFANAENRPAEKLVWREAAQAELDFLISLRPVKVKR